MYKYLEAGLYYALRELVVALLKVAKAVHIFLWLLSITFLGISTLCRRLLDLYFCVKMVPQEIG